MGFLPGRDRRWQLGWRPTGEGQGPDLREAPSSLGNRERAAIAPPPPHILDAGHMPSASYPFSPASHVPAPTILVPTPAITALNNGLRSMVPTMAGRGKHRGVPGRGAQSHAGKSQQWQQAERSAPPIRLQGVLTGTSGLSQLPGRSMQSQAINLLS